GQFLRSGQNRWDGFLVILKISQMLFPEGTIVGCDSLAIVWIFTRFELVDEVSHEQRVGLIRTEYQRLLVLVDLRHENLDTLFFSFTNLDAAVEVWFVVK